MVATPPRLMTPRLVLDAHGPADLDDVLAMWSDPLVRTHMRMAVPTRTEAWTRVLRYRGLWAMLGYGYWAVRERSGGRFVSDIGFADFRRAVVPSIDGVPEAGWVLAAWSHGGGYATEAVRAALAWLDAGPHDASVCLINPANAASLRVAARLGYAAPREVRFDGHPTTLLERRVR